MEHPRVIRVIPHDPRWKSLFHEEEGRLRALLGEDAVRIHHIGSTSVPGLAAKPIVDVLAEVTEIEAVDRRRSAFGDGGYRWFGEYGIPGRRFLIRGFDPDRSHHVHVFAAGHERVRDHLEFRDYLIAHPGEAAAYGRLKIDLARRHPDDIDAYTAGKAAFIRESVRRAAAWAKSREEGGMNRDVRRLEEARREDFYRVHHESNGHGWCFCVAWWVPGWEGWGERRAEENRRVREDLFARGEEDGYLLYLDGVPAGWCQAVRRDRLRKLAAQFSLAPDEDAWAIGCFLVAPPHRRRGNGRFLLSRVIEDLWKRGAGRIEAFPKRVEGAGEMDLWNGPEAMFRKAGFRIEREDDTRPVLALNRPRQEGEGEGSRTSS